MFNFLKKIFGKSNEGLTSTVSSKNQKSNVVVQIPKKKQKRKVIEQVPKNEQISNVIVHYDEAVEMWPIDRLQAEAELLNASALYCLGRRFASGDGVEKDLSRMLNCYKIASELGLPNAMSELGICYLKGKGLDSNYREAVRLLQKAAENEISDAMHYLGSCYLYGKGVPKNQEKALEWYEKAANLDNPSSLYTLGMLYRGKEYVQKDKNRAYHYLKRAALLGNKDAVYEVMSLYESENGLLNISSKQRAKDIAEGKLSIELPENLIAPEDDPEFLFMEGAKYEFGVNVQQDYAKAAAYYEKAARKDHARAQFHLSNCYLFGNGVQQNTNLAMDLLETSAENGYLDAQYNLGLHYYNGDTVERDYQWPAKWLAMAMLQGDPDARKAMQSLLFFVPRYMIDDVMKYIKENPL